MRKWQKMTREQRVEAIRDGVADGLSASQIAARHGCTKNSIIGAASRASISLGGGANRSPSPPRPSWRDMSAAEKTDLVAAQLTRGKSYREIANMVSGATPDAIKGCAKRLKRRTALPKAKRTGPVRPVVEIARRKRTAGPVNIMDLEWRDCRAPLWEDAPRRPLRSPDDWAFCGRRSEFGSSYCKFHSEKFSVPENKKRPR